MFTGGPPQPGLGRCAPFMLSHIDPCDHILVCMVCHSIIQMLTITCFDPQCAMILSSFLLTVTLGTWLIMTLFVSGKDHR